MVKSDLKERPIFHRIKNRIEAHLVICFAALLVIKETEKILKLKNFSLKRAIEILGKVGRGYARIKNVQIEIDSEISGEDAKIGLGSSAALCVGIVAGILELNGVKTKNMPDKLKVFKLACIAHYLAQKGIGSGYDVTVAVFGGLLLYKRFDGRWLGNEIEDGNKISWIVEQEWPGLEIEILEIPKWLKLNVAYSGKSASTTEMIKKMDVFKNRDSKNYRRLIEYIGATTEGIAEAIKGKNLGRFLELVTENRRLLKELATESSLELETDELVEIVRKKKKVTMRDASNVLHVDEAQIESWLNVLEEHNYIKLIYPKIGEPYIVPVELPERQIIKKRVELEERAEKVESVAKEFEFRIFWR